jgi:hypothetical protein
MRASQRQTAPSHGLMAKSRVRRVTTHMTLERLVTYLYRVLRAYDTPGTATNNTAPSAHSTRATLYSRASERAQKSHHHPAQTNVSRTAEGRDVFTSNDDSNNARAQSSIDTHALQARPSSRSRSLQSFHAGWAATLSHRGGVAASPLTRAQGDTTT